MNNVQGAYTFDKLNKTITITSTVTAVNLIDMWSRFVDWFSLVENMDIRPALRYSGFDVIPSGFTGATFFVTNGWRVVYNTATTSITGVLFSDDYNTGYWTVTGEPIHPVTVSAVVNTVIVQSSTLTLEQHTKLMETSTQRDVYGAALIN